MTAFFSIYQKFCKFLIEKKNTEINKYINRKGLEFK